jgi:hypothetical protein
VDEAEVGARPEADEHDEDERRDQEEAEPDEARERPRRGDPPRAALAAGGLLAGEAVAMARGLGEFGATIMFAGSLQGVTQTLSLAIYEEFDVNFDTALAISAFLVLVSGALLLSVKVVPGWTRFAWMSSSRAARSVSS